MSQPRLRNEEAIFGFDDYPGESLRRSEFGIVSAIVKVSPEGRATSCFVTETSGYPNLDRATCALYMRKARFDPAVDAEGSPY